MSIMDHDPKYAKLRAWRRTAYRDWIVGEYGWYIRMCMRPPAPLCRQAVQIAQEEAAECAIHHYPYHNQTVRTTWTGSLYPWKALEPYTDEGGKR